MTGIRATPNWMKGLWYLLIFPFNIGYYEVVKMIIWVWAFKKYLSFYQKGFSLSLQACCCEAQDWQKYELSHASPTFSRTWSLYGWLLSSNFSGKKVIGCCLILLCQLCLDFYVHWLSFALLHIFGMEWASFPESLCEDWWKELVLKEYCLCLLWANLTFP